MTQGTLIVTTELTDVNSLQKVDINDEAVSVTLAEGDLLKLYNESRVTVYYWTGNAPKTGYKISRAKPINPYTSAEVGVTGVVYVSANANTEVNFEVIKGA